jgi:hypothetical protein
LQSCHTRTSNGIASHASISVSLSLVIPAGLHLGSLMPSDTSAGWMVYMPPHHGAAAAHCSTMVAEHS